MSDAFTPYETGLTRLLEQLGTKHPRYADALTLEAQLRENIVQVRLQGDYENRRADRNRILGQLNQLALETVGVSFNVLIDGSTLTQDLVQARSDIVRKRKPPSSVWFLLVITSILVVAIVLFSYLSETSPFIKGFVVHYADGSVESFAVGDLVRVPAYTQVLVEALVDQANTSCNWSAVKGARLPAKGCATQYTPPIAGNQDALSVLVQSPLKRWQTFAGLHINVVQVEP